MLKKQNMSVRNQIGFYSLGDLVPKEHLLRDIDKYVNFNFIYELVEDKYNRFNGRPSLDPVLFSQTSFDSIPIRNQKYEINN